MGYSGVKVTQKELFSKMGIGVVFISELIFFPIEIIGYLYLIHQMFFGCISPT